MANINAPKGLTPVQDRSGNPWNQQADLMCVPSTDATYTYAIGDVVKSINGFDVNGIPYIQKISATTDQPLGVVVGVRVADPGVSLQGTTLDLTQTYVPAAKSRNYYLYVVCDPDLIFEAQCDADAGNVLYQGNAAMYKNINPNVPTASQANLIQNPLSSMTLLSTTLTANTAMFRLHGPVIRVNNVFSTTSGVGSPYLAVRVSWNKHEYFGTWTAV